MLSGPLQRQRPITSSTTLKIQTSVYAGHDGVILWSNWLITGRRRRIRTGTIFRTGSEPSPTWCRSSCCCNWCLCFDLSSSDVTHLALRNHCFHSAPCWWKCLSSLLQIKDIKKKVQFHNFTINLAGILQDSSDLFGLISSQEVVINVIFSF